MESLVIIVAIVAIPAVTGVALDRLLLPRTKIALYDRLLRMWDRLDETSVPDLPRLMATTTLATGYRFLGFELGWPHVTGRTTLLSFALTYSALWIGSAIDVGRVADPLIAARTYQGGLIALLAINLTFDFATAFVTWHVLRFVQRHGLGLSSLAIVIDISAAITLAYLCGLTALWFGGEIASSDVVAQAFECLASAWSMERGTMDQLTIGMYSSTTLLPTVTYMLLLTVLLMAKPVLIVGKSLAQYFLERTLEDDPKELIVFTLTGLLCSIVAAIATAVVKVAEVASN